MKRLFSLIFAAVLLLSQAACAPKQTESIPNTSSPQQTQSEFEQTIQEQFPPIPEDVKFTPLGESITVTEDYSNELTYTINKVVVSKETKDYPGYYEDAVKNYSDRLITNENDPNDYVIVFDQDKNLLYGFNMVLVEFTFTNEMDREVEKNFCSKRMSICFQDGKETNRIETPFYMTPTQPNSDRPDSERMTYTFQPHESVDITLGYRIKDEDINRMVWKIGGPYSEYKTPGVETSLSSFPEDLYYVKLEPFEKK